MALSATQFTLLCIAGIILLARPCHAFGAGNIGSASKIEGENWRHGDLEDVLLTLATSKAMGGKKFGKLDVKRVYFGNWLRDYSQAIDVGTVKSVSAEAIRILLWVLGFMSFGYGTKEFEVTTDRLGCYRPEEHIDNPKDYADNLDARQYDRRLRGPVDERRELAIDPETGMKSYIASENLGIDTSAGLVRKLFGRSIELGRRYARNNNKSDLYEALRLLGTGCHCLEDFSAHSNYTELALIELGERDIFPHVGRNTQVRLRGARNPVFPIVTGTFGGVDFLHSVTGEFDDKVTQSEIQELEGTLQQAQNQGGNSSVLQGLLSKIPSGVFGGKDEAGKVDELKANAASHQMQNTQISPRQPEEWTRYLNDVQKQIYPIIEWHDEVMQGINETIEKIPILPDLIEQIQEQVNVMVFSLLAPFVLPVIDQIKSELNTGSSAIIQSSADKQHIVFSDDKCSDPTHSMLSKDHFSNVLNEPAGKIAGQVLRWAVPQLIACWDDERIDVDRTITRIIRGVFHHPALRDSGEDGASDGRRAMFGIIQQWWSNKSEREKDDLRDQLSRRGVESGRNHKPGVQDHGHGSGKKLGMANVYSGSHSGGGSSAATDGLAQIAGEAVGGGALGGLVGGLAGALGGNILGGDILGGALGGNTGETYQNQSFGDDGSRTSTVTQIGSSGNRYGQAQYSQTEDRHGGIHQEYNRYEQHNQGGRMTSEVHHEESSSYGGFSSDTRRYGDDTGRRHQEYGRQTHGNQRDDDSSYNRPTHENTSSRTSYGRQDDKSHQSRHDDINYGRQQEFNYGGRYESQQSYSTHGHNSSHGGRQSQRENDDQPTYDTGRHQANTGYGGGYGSQQDTSSYGRQEETSRYGGQQESNYGGGYGRQEQTSNYVRQEESNYGGGYGRQEQTSNYGREQQSSYGSGGYGRSDNDGGSYGRQERSQYGESGGRGRGEDNDMPGGFGGDEDDSGGYGRRRNEEEDDGNRGYGGGRGNNYESRGDDSGGYGY